MRRSPRFFLNDMAYLRIDVVVDNERRFLEVAELYKNDLPFANALRYGAELLREVLTAIKSGNRLQASASYKRYASHWNETLLVMARVRGARI